MKFLWVILQYYAFILKSGQNHLDNKLVKRGYIIREKNLEDGRESLLILTNLGEAVNKKHKQYEKYFMKEFMNLFREEDYEALKGILKRSRLCTLL